MQNFAETVWGYFKPFKKHILVALSLVVLNQILGLIWPRLFGILIGSLSDPSNLPSQTYVYGMVAIGFALAAAQRLGFAARDYYQTKHLDDNLEEHISKASMRRMMEFSISQHVNEHSGIKRSILNRGESSLQSLYAILLNELVPMVLCYVAVQIILFWMAWQIALVLLAGSVSYGVTAWINTKRIYPKIRKNENYFVRHGRFQGEILDHMSIVLANSREQETLREHAHSLRKGHRYSIKLWTKYIPVYTIRAGILIVTEFAILALCISKIYAGDGFSVADALSITGWGAMALIQVNRAATMQRQLLRLHGQLSRYFDMLAISPQVEVKPNAVSLEEVRGEITFEDVVFRHAERETALGACDNDEKGDYAALNNLSLHIPAGETVAIVGSSGAGKSTLIWALLRAHDPDEGQILVDGHNLRDLDLHSFRASVGYVPQTVRMWDNTIRYNILYGLNGRAKKMTEVDIERVARMARVDTFVQQMEGGLDTYIGERGVKLSGGQCQRVGIAMALAKNPAILIFDEATSSLDPENEFYIRQAIEEAAKGRTTLIIAHRFSTIRNVDRVVVMEQGKIAGIGTHSELARTCEPYNRLIKHQVLSF